MTIWDEDLTRNNRERREFNQSIREQIEYDARHRMTALAIAELVVAAVMLFIISWEFFR